MGKLPKIILSCVCAAFVIAIIGLGLWKTTYTPQARDSSIDEADNRTKGRMDNTDSGTDGIKITTSDGTELIIMNPSLLGDNLDAYEFEWSNSDDEDIVENTSESVSPAMGQPRGNQVPPLH